MTAAYTLDNFIDTRPADDGLLDVRKLGTLGYLTGTAKRMLSDGNVAGAHELLAEMEKIYRWEPPARAVSLPVVATVTEAGNG